MSRLAALFRVESFRGTMSALLSLSDEEFEGVRERTVGDYEAVIRDESAPSSETGLVERAMLMLYDTAVREGVDAILEDIRETMPDQPPAAVARLAAAITPGPEDEARVSGLSQRDGFLPILTAHRFALDLRIVNDDPEHPRAVPIVTARLIFDDPVANGGNALVFQITPSDLKNLRGALGQIDKQLRALLASEAKVTFPEWGHAHTDK